MKVKSIEMFNLILEEAKKKNHVNELVSMKDKNNQNIYSFAAYNGKAEIADAILKLKSFEQDDLYKMLHEARQAAWDFPEARKEFTEQTVKIRKLFKPHRLLKFPQDASIVSFEDAYQTLYGEAYSADVPQSKELAVKKAIAQLYSLFHTPSRCIKYLKALNDQFKIYYRAKHGQDFPAIDPLTYQFQVLDGTAYPFPTADYQKLDKNSELQKFIIAMLSADPYNIAAEAFKWVGFIPEPLADEMFGRGDFVYESRLGPGLFHSKYAHMLQNMIAALALEVEGNENPEINTAYTENGQTKHISFKDILFGLVNLRHYENNETLWLSVRDRRNPDEFTFSDPNRISSFIMCNRKAYGLDALSNYLIDTFCSGFMELEKAFKQTHPGLNLTRKEFIEQSKDLNSNYFEMSTHLLNYVYQHEKDSFEAAGKANHARLFSGSSYLAIPKTYTPDLDAKPNQYQL